MILKLKRERENVAKENRFFVVIVVGAVDVVVVVVAQYANQLWMQNRVEIRLAWVLTE